MAYYNNNSNQGGYGQANPYATQNAPPSYGQRPTQGYNGGQSQSYNGGQSQGYNGGQGQGYNGGQSQPYNGAQSQGYSGGQSQGHNGGPNPSYNGGAGQSQRYNGGQSPGYNGRQNQGYGGGPPQGRSGPQSPPPGGVQNQGYGGGQRHGQQDNVEMQPLSSGPPPSQSGTPVQQDANAILNECRTVGRAIDDLENRLQELQRLQRGFTSGNGTTNKEIDATSADIMTGYRGLGDRVRRIKGQREAGLARNKPQVDALDRRIRKAINTFQQQESQFRKEMQEQQRRQYLIVNPQASEAEIREATMDGGDTQIFQQALMNSDRRGQAQSTMRHVQQRHDAIRQIEKTMIELQELFQDLDSMVVQQDALVETIEQKAEETTQHLEAGNIEVAKAVVSARAARKKKWICLGICIAIILVIIIIIFVYLAVTGHFSSSSNNNSSSN